jgi:hypothetical protein
LTADTSSPKVSTSSDIAKESIVEESSKRESGEQISSNSSLEGTNRDGVDGWVSLYWSDDCDNVGEDIADIPSSVA